MGILKKLKELFAPDVDQDVVEDLLTWEEENDAVLPDGMSAEDVAGWEAKGFIVDLLTGKIFRNQEDLR